MKPSLLLIGPTPPPHHGVSMAMQALLTSSMLERFQILHVDLADRRGIEHVDKPDFHDVLLFTKQWLRLLALLLRQRPALVYLAVSQTTLGFLRDSLLLWPCHLLGARLVLHLHGANFRTWYEARGILVRACVRLVLRRVARVVVLGESLRGIFAGLVAPEKIAVVANGIEWRRQVERHAMALKNRRRRVLYLGTLNHLKGVLVLMEAIPMVLHDRQDAEFVLAGPWSDQTDRREVDEYLYRHGARDYVIFTGPISGEAKMALFESADVFVFPGVQQEGQPLVVLEAMASGLPVLFTDRGCLRETVVEGETGLEVRREDPVDLAERLLWLLNHPEKMAKMGAKGRTRYEQLYTKERFVEAMVGVCEDVLDEGARSECRDETPAGRTV